MITMFHNEHQWSINGASTERQRSVNDIRSCIMDTLREMERTEPTIHLSSGFIFTDVTDYIVSASYN